MIILDAVVLTIQSAKDISLSADANGPAASKGYFLGWEDYVIFILFCFFRYLSLPPSLPPFHLHQQPTEHPTHSVEALARICVSGFLLDPEVPLSRLFANPFRTSSSPHDLTRSSSLHETASISRHSSLLQRSRSLRQRGLARVRSVLQNLYEPFELVPSRLQASEHHHHQQQRPSALPKRSRSDTVQSAKAHTPLFEKAWSKVQDVHDHIRHPTDSGTGYHPTTGLSQAFRSEQSIAEGNADVIGLPFRLSVAAAQGKTHRNVPYLRQSWSRIDFVAVVSFWITFLLATLGLEESGTYHIGIFRAMSVLRTARLLAITSGTTVG
jgi:voltage-dependent calcium channel